LVLTSVGPRRNAYRAFRRLSDSEKLDESFFRVCAERKNELDGHGRGAFTVPRFDRYLRRNYELPPPKSPR
jgi:hypothetical protein